MRSYRRSLYRCEVVKYIVKRCRAPPALHTIAASIKINGEYQGEYQYVLPEFENRRKGSKFQSH